MGRRARVTIIEDGSERIVAKHDGFSPIIHKREFSLRDRSFSIVDSLSKPAEAVSYIHLAPTVRVLSADSKLVKTDAGSIIIENAKSVEVTKGEISTEYNIFKETSVIKIHFDSNVKYRVEA